MSAPIVDHITISLIANKRKLLQKGKFYTFLRKRSIAAFRLTRSRSSTSAS